MVVSYYKPEKGFNFYNRKGEEIRKKQIEHDEYILCPVCGEYTFPNSSSYDICPVCGWENDGFEECPNENSGANKLNLVDSNKHFPQERLKDPRYRWFKEEKKK
ncbi:MAG: CPCC family cysteine-rich protein [Bacilli bacterium]